MPTRKPKKSRAVTKKGVRMKPWTNHPPSTVYAAFTADRLYHVSTERHYAEDAARDLPDGMAFTVFTYSLPTDAERKLEEVRKYVKETLLHVGGKATVKPRTFAYIAGDILRILNSTPTAKGGRK